MDSAKRVADSKDWIKGAGGDAPTLHRMGGSDWQKAKARVRSAAREIAHELVALYRARQLLRCLGRIWRRAQ